MKCTATAAPDHGLRPMSPNPGHCLRCGHLWVFRKSKPMQCPNCKQSGWNREGSRSKVKPGAVSKSLRDRYRNDPEYREHRRQVARISEERRLEFPTYRKLASLREAIAGKRQSIELHVRKAEKYETELLRLLAERERTRQMWAAERRLLKVI